jgi:5-methylcytosine-specific restriction endonuclease McrA
MTPDRKYKTAHWQRLRRHQLRIEPLCKFCLERGIVTPATIADHIEPHKGDVNSFFLGKLQSLCWSCHSGQKQQIEKKGYYKGCDVRGMPLDPNAPCYR